MAGALASLPGKPLEEREAVLGVGGHLSRRPGPAVTEGAEGGGLPPRICDKLLGNLGEMLAFLDVIFVFV